MIGAIGSGSRSGHCIALNNIRSFLSSDNQNEQSKFLVNVSGGGQDDDNMISSEGCFACDMNKASKRTKVRRSGTFKTENLSKRKRKVRRMRSNHKKSQRKRRQANESFVPLLAKPRDSSYGSNDSTAEHPVERLSITLSAKETRKDR